MRVKAAGSQLLILSSPHPESIFQAFRQAANLGVKPKYRWYLSEYDKDLFAKHRDLLEGTYMEAIPSAFDSSFISKFSSKYGGEPDLYSAMGYDATKSLLAGVRSAGSAGIPSTSRYLIENHFQDTAISGFSFRDDRTVSMALTASRFVDGEQRRIR
ncbi:MAG: hypothetical protein DCC75_07445 [Proteobacteria bacterium]|nr:MAG: hypothetical protein DCC75_07445 [Pseudomonadota bacterium]